MSRGEWTLDIACQDVVCIAMESLPCPRAISSAAAHRTSYPCFPAKKSLPFLELYFLSKKWEAVQEPPDSARLLRSVSRLGLQNRTDIAVDAVLCNRAIALRHIVAGSAPPQHHYLR